MWHITVPSIFTSLQRRTISCPRLCWKHKKFINCHCTDTLVQVPHLFSLYRPPDHTHSVELKSLPCSFKLSSLDSVSLLVSWGINCACRELLVALYLLKPCHVLFWKAMIQWRFPPTFLVFLCLIPLWTCRMFK